MLFVTKEQSNNAPSQGAKLIQQLMKQNISSLKIKISTSKGRGLVTCWLCIMLRARCTDVKCCKDKHNGTGAIVSKVLWLWKLVPELFPFGYKSQEDKKKLCKRMCKLIVHPEYSEKENLVHPGTFVLSRTFVLASLLAQK